MNTRNILSILMAIAAIGCNDSPTATTPDLGPSVPPKVGSTFTYHEMLFDAKWQEVVGSQRIVVAEVIASGTTYWDRSNVTVFREGSTHVYLSYGNNGDIYFCGDGPSESWEKWPVGSGTLTEDTVATTVTPSGDSIYTARWTSRAEDEVTKTPVGELAAHILITNSMTLRADGKVDAHFETRRWYVPALGVPARTRTIVLPNAGEPLYRKIKVLVGYTLT